MKTKTKFTIYIICLHLVLALISYKAFGNTWPFLIIQFFLVLSLFLGVKFFYLADKPYRHLVDSIGFLEAQDVNTSIVKSGNNLLDKLVDKYNEIITHIREERLRLQGQGQFLEELIEVSPIGIVISDFDGVITEVNPSAALHLGISEEALIDQNINTVLSITGYEATENTVSNVNQRKLKMSQSKVKYKGFYRQCILLEDITNELLKTEKEAYGRVIRMMSHEVNNSTGAVNSILQSLNDYLFEQSEDKSWSEVIHIAIDRNKNLGKFVDNFASVLRVYTPQMKEVSISEFLQKIAKIWAYPAKEKSIDLQLDDQTNGKEVVTIDPIQIEQVLNNIIKNAFEAIGTNGKIKIVIKENGKLVSIEDNGCGISADEALHMQSMPFYSNKTQGQGIGLMITKEILNNHQAKYTLKTDSDGWTRFMIWF
jgi:two-component system, NtrC family, nitrogen regulation sensor histidine kinase NtrY